LTLSAQPFLDVITVMPGNSVLRFVMRFAVRGQTLAQVSKSSRKCIGLRFTF
jgi:hypothetical protein